MQRPFAFATLMLAGLLFQDACSTPPITIGLSDVAIGLAIAVNSAGKVIFPASPLDFQNPVPGTRVASVTVRGEARLKKRANVSFNVYATGTDPGELGCNPFPSGEFYLCDPDTNGIEKVSQEAIPFEGNAGPVPFELCGTMLAEGIHAKSLHLGASIEGGTAGNVLILGEDARHRATQYWEIAKCVQKAGGPKARP